ncbi:MAG: glycosyltransferase family 39 protein [Acidobacteria bacterium]|nr:glycosyltransferase family 39 protein [Acidobacteriota bacterium]
MKPRHYFLLFVIALLARVGYLVVRGPVLAHDTEGYFRLADNLAVHGAFSLNVDAPYAPTIRRAPLYPAILAFFKIFGLFSSLIIASLQSLLDSLIAVAIFVLARRVATLKWAMLAALGYALHPGAIVASVSLLNETLFTALLVCGIGFLAYAMIRSQWQFYAISGTMFGLACLCRPIALIVPFLCAVVMLLNRQRSHSWRYAVLVPALAFLVIAPWAVRCSLVAKRLTLVQGASAVNFYIPTRWDWDQKDQQHLWPAFAEEDEYGKRLTAATNPQEMAQADQFGFRKAVENIRDNPRAYLQSRLRSFPYLVLSSFDNFTEFNQSFGVLWVQRDWLHLIIKIILMTLFSIIPLMLAVFGLFRIQTHSLALLCSSVWIYTLLIHIPMWIEYRFWIPALPFLLINAAQGMQWLHQKRGLFVRRLQRPKNIAIDVG